MPCLELMQDREETGVRHAAQHPHIPKPLALPIPYSGTRLPDRSCSYPFVCTYLKWKDFRIKFKAMLSRSCRGSLNARRCNIPRGCAWTKFLQTLFLHARRWKLIADAGFGDHQSDRCIRGLPPPGAVRYWGQCRVLPVPDPASVICYEPGSTAWET